MWVIKTAGVDRDGDRRAEAEILRQLLTDRAQQVGLGCYPLSEETCAALLTASHSTVPDRRRQAASTSGRRVASGYVPFRVVSKTTRPRRRCPLD